MSENLDLFKDERGESAAAEKKESSKAGQKTEKTGSKPPRVDGVSTEAEDLFEADQSETEEAEDERDTEVEGTESEQPKPLADRMRPATLDAYVGKMSPFLRTAILNDNLPSIILWGPPGSGKTSVANIIAHTTRSNYVPFSAVLGGVKEVRDIIERAKESFRVEGKKTILFVDEIHRFNKAQQDAFLPHVEKAVITLVGATTENPSFSVIAPLLSRCKVIKLEKLFEKDLTLIVNRALEDKEKGLGKLGFTLDKRHILGIARSSRGDARQALNILENLTAYLMDQQFQNVTDDILEEFLERHVLLYDKSGDEHYNTISAFIKSMRGSDPDAALYWMMRMLEAGEDPLFILRRMIIFASEDIGNADPRALDIAVAAYQAFQIIGLPEGVINMAHAVTYLASVPKSNASYRAMGHAKDDVIKHGNLEVPLHLRNAPTRLMKELGYGSEYKYPHDFPGHFVDETYLPEELKNRKYYEPTDLGFEKYIRERLQFLEQQKKKGGDS